MEEDLHYQVPSQIWPFVIFSIWINKECQSVTHGFVFWIASIQETDYTKETVKAGADYVKEFVIEQEGNQQQVNLDQTCFIQKGCKMCLQVNLEQEQVQEVQEEEEEEVEQKEAPEYTTIVYQDKVGVGQFFIISLEL